jgi:hypothetical protein
MWLPLERYRSGEWAPIDLSYRLGTSSEVRLGRGLVGARGVEETGEQWERETLRRVGCATG